MRILAGRGAHVRFTSLSQSSADAITSAFGTVADPLLSNFSCHRQGVRELMKASGVELDKVCLLDPKAETALSPEDGGDGRFEWFLFGVC